MRSDAVLKNCVFQLAVFFGLVAGFNNPLWTDKTGATKTLTEAGLKPVQVGGYAWLNGGESDVYKTKFRALNAQGQEVDGAVTRGLLFKGATIRYN